jgi:1-acyl-sn-glycerol-3-phosphate acyltransferase
MSLVDDARFAARCAGFAGLTGSLLIAMETHRGLARPERKDPVLYDYMELYGHGLLRLSGVEVTARGPFVDEKKRYPGTDARGKGRIFVMNHRSLLDVFATLAFVEATIVSRADLAEWPVIGLAARRVKTLFVDRTDKKSGQAVVRAMVAGVNGGRAVMVYPEGTTFAGDDVHPFRPGAFLAAERTGAEIVPVGIAYGGDSAAFVDEPFAAHMRRVAGAKKTKVGLVIGEAFTPEPGRPVGEIADEARAKVQALVHEARALIG